MTPASRFVARVAALAGKESIHIRRDPRTLALALVMPVVLLLLFGYGVSFDIDRLPLAVVDLDRTQATRELVRHLYASHELVPPDTVAADEVLTQARAEELLRLGRALGVLTLPSGLERDLAQGVQVGLVVDGRDSVSANQLLAKTEAIMRSTSVSLLGASGAPPIEVRLWTRFNPEGRSPLYLVPGLAAYLMAIAAVMLTALAVATEWERGSMEQLFASPVGRLEIIFGKLLPYLVIGGLQMLLVLTVGAWAFDVPIRGSLGLLFAAGLIFLLAMLGQGLLISVVAKNQLVATQAGALSSLLPSLLLSGLVFPVENMPRILQYLAAVLPAKHMVHVLRSIMLKGSTFSELWPDFLAMSLFAVFIVTVATKRFVRKLA